MSKKQRKNEKIIKKQEKLHKEKLEYLVNMLDLMTKTRKKITVEDIHELKSQQINLRKNESKKRKNERRRQREIQRQLMQIEKKKKKLRKKIRQERIRQLMDDMKETEED